MALTATTTRTDGLKPGYVVVIDGTSDDGSDVTITGVPNSGRIVRVLQAHASGSASNHQPQVAEAASSARLIYQSSSTAVATDVNDAPTGAVYVVTNNTLYYQSGVDSGSDNEVDARIYIEAWPS